MYVVNNKAQCVMSRYFPKVETISLSPWKELKAGNGFLRIELPELQAVGLSQSASSTRFDLFSSLGKSCFLHVPASAEPNPGYH